jgi:HK97 family phage major capsid protein
MAETKTIEQMLTEREDKLTTEAKSVATEAAKAETAELKTKLTAAETELTELKIWKVKKDEADVKNQAWIDSEVAGGKRGTLGTEVKSFNTILGETIERNADAIRNFRPQGGELRFDMLPDESKDKNGEVKAVGDMSISNNFPGATTMYQDVRGPMIESPYNRVYVGDLLPQASSTGTQVVYPKETGPASGTEGGAAPWTDYTANKAQIDWDITSQTNAFTWIAGWTVIQRDMLDDIPWMTSYLQNRLLVSLKTAETDFILNGSGAIPGFQDLASPYNGTLTVPVDRIIDAAIGQIPDATSEFYMGNLVITRVRDLVTKIALNKASGSGEYDLPAGAVVLNPDGTVRIGNLKVVGTTAMEWDTFYALDTRATTWITRIRPELRMFEDATLAKKNQIMFRIEERATLIVFNNAAIIKGVLQTS